MGQFWAGSAIDDERAPRNEAARSWPQWRRALYLVLFVTAWPASGLHAQDSADPQVEAEYQQLITDALNEYDRGSWEESSALFDRAHQLRPSARTLRGLGLAAYEARRYPDSIRYLTQSLSDSRSPLTPKQRGEVEATLNRARLFVGYLRVNLEPNDATFTINGVTLQPDPEGNIITDVGTIEIEARAPGYGAATRRLQMRAGDRRTLQLSLTPDGAAALSPESAASGSVISATTSTTRADDSPYATWKWVTAGAALAALAAGGTLLAIQKSGAASYRDECVNSPMPASNCDSRNKLLGSTLWTGSIVGLSVGAGLGAVGVVLFVLDAQHGPSERTTALACSVHGPLGAECELRF